MPAKTAALVLAIAATVALAGCTPTSGDATATPSATPSDSGVVSGGNSTTLPGCERVTEAMQPILGDLAYNEPAGDEQLTPEDFEQRVCVYTNPDASIRLGITISAIPFLPEELDAFRALPNSRPDDRATALDAVLETLKVEGDDASHLESTLFLFDEVYSIAIQGQSDNAPTSETLPQVTVGAAADAAFAVRALID